MVSLLEFLYRNLLWYFDLQLGLEQSLFDIKLMAVEYRVVQKLGIE